MKSVGDTTNMHRQAFVIMMVTDILEHKIAHFKIQSCFSRINEATYWSLSKYGQLLKTWFWYMFSWTNTINTLRFIFRGALNIGCQWRQIEHQQPQSQPGYSWHNSALFVVKALTLLIFFTVTMYLKHRSLHLMMTASRSGRRVSTTIVSFIIICHWILNTPVIARKYNIRLTVTVQRYTLTSCYVLFWTRSLHKHDLYRTHSIQCIPGIILEWAQPMRGGVTM